MEAVENIALLVLLLLCGVGLTWAVLLAFIYYLEAINE